VRDNAGITSQLDGIVGDGEWKNVAYKRNVTCVKSINGLVRAYTRNVSQQMYFYRRARVKITCHIFV